MGRAQVSLIHCNDLVKASPVVVCPAAERATLDFLRTSYQTCRTKPRHDIFAACDLLTCDRHVATTTYAEAILRTLPQTLGRRPMIHGLAMLWLLLTNLGFLPCFMPAVMKTGIT